MSLIVNRYCGPAPGTVWAIALLLCCTLSLLTSAHADVTGKWSISNSEAVKVYYKDDKHMRMDVGNGTYMIVTGEKVYTVMNQGGQKIVMDMDAMGGAMQMMQGMVNQQIEEQVTQYDPSSIKYTKTGRKEIIAGIKGDVYQVSVMGPKGLEKSEIVTSNDKSVIMMQQAFQKISQRMAQSMLSRDAMSGFNQAAEMAKSKGIGGMLRFQQAMVLKSLDTKSLPDSLFQLPKDATLMSIPGFGP